MKTIISLLICTFMAVGMGFAQQQITPAKKGVQYGKKIDAKNAISVAALEKKLQTEENFTGKITGEVQEVCKKKGCFLTLKRADGESVMVRFTDYAYFVPADIVGKQITVEGRAKMKETSVEWLQHYAEDKGASKEEIAKITQPKKDISIVADGVVVLN
ncbi:DUF4920 domain-containing protein [Sphingobacterium oryzagri]|uniref:DUF4920 domain-containing protein n=1 Tax=Sphingobacterium oryzagri TaxID=3025669 RepID=A0ABY7WLC7_9SPHI|nr:DUF4920 domain-containing protein [Sphingobacterium sp. KACC 22765]WDF68159.1 DUF4920 domain-containing protein [Sphingobacterium sp. KACC 22765]